MRTPAEQPIRLYSWNLRFFDGDDMAQPPQDAADAHLTEFLMQRAAPLAGAPAPDLARVIETAGQEDATPWYSEYREEYFRMMRFGAHETQDQPVACE